MNQRGFTLFEMAVVMLIVGTLASILLPALARARASARLAACQANLQQLGMALHMYAAEHEGELPWDGGNNRADRLNEIHQQYLDDARVFFCPLNERQNHESLEYLQPPYPTGVEEESSLRNSYDYLGAYSVTPILLPPNGKPLPRLPLMWDIGGGASNDRPYPSRSHTSGGNVLWLDGSSGFMKAESWDQWNLPVPALGIRMPALPEVPNFPGMPGYL